MIKERKWLILIMKDCRKQMMEDNKKAWYVAKTILPIMNKLNQHKTKINDCCFWWASQCPKSSWLDQRACLCHHSYAGHWAYCGDNCWEVDRSQSNQRSCQFAKRSVVAFLHFSLTTHLTILFLHFTATWCFSEFSTWHLCCILKASKAHNNG